MLLKPSGLKDKIRELPVEQKGERVNWEIIEYNVYHSVELLAKRYYYD